MAATLLVDLFVTVKGGPAVSGEDRCKMTLKSLRSLFENTPRDKFRLTVCLDGTDLIGSGLTTEERNAFLGEVISIIQEHADYVLQAKKNEGLGPTINRAVAHVKSINDWYAHPTHGDPSYVAPFLCMLQDDVQYSPGWLEKLSQRFVAFEKIHNLGFASGVECIEHPVVKDLGGGMVLKDWIRATCMFARREYWESMMPIPRFDPETGRVRGKPNDGIGSGVDWWLIRNHENSICKTGRKCLVMPGLLQHAGYDQSTWLSREMPESESDKEKVRNG